MNKLSAAVVSAFVLMSQGSASANNGILSSNPAEPYYTTPQEFRVLGERSTQRMGSQEKSLIQNDRQIGTEPTKRPEDPARGAMSGK